MAATLVERKSYNYYVLTSSKGREIGVCFHSWGRISVYIQRSRYPGLSAGRQFGTIAEAIESYKAADVKAALASLLSA